MDTAVSTPIKQISSKKAKALLRSKLWYEANKNKLHVFFKRKDYTAKWRSANPARYLCQIARGRAKRDGIPFDMKPEDLIIPSECPILKTPFVYSTPSAMSVDRKVPALGYVKGNVWVISRKANAMKQDASEEELRKFANWVLDK